MKGLEEIVTLLEGWKVELKRSSLSNGMAAGNDDVTIFIIGGEFVKHFK